MSVLILSTIAGVLLLVNLNLLRGDGKPAAQSAPSQWDEQDSKYIELIHRTLDGRRMQNAHAGNLLDAEAFFRSTGRHPEYAQQARRLRERVNDLADSCRWHACQINVSRKVAKDMSQQGLEYPCPETHYQQTRSLSERAEQWAQEHNRFLLDSEPFRQNIREWTENRDAELARMTAERQKAAQQRARDEQSDGAHSENYLYSSAFIVTDSGSCGYADTSAGCSGD